MEERRIRRILYRVLRKTGVAAGEIQVNASFSDDLNFDNLDWAIFNFYLASYFKMDIKNEELVQFADLNETLCYLRKSAQVV